MNRFDAADRIARAIFFYGIDCLSITEENILRNDNEFRREVDAILQKLRRSSFLENDNSHSLDIFSGNNGMQKVIIWNDEEFEYHGIIWKNSNTQNVSLEIKRYFKEDYDNTLNIGAHELVMEKFFDGREYDSKEIIDSCITILKNYGCPEEKIIKEFN